MKNGWKLWSMHYYALYSRPKVMCFLVFLLSLDKIQFLQIEWMQLIKKVSFWTFTCDYLGVCNIARVEKINLYVWHENSNNQRIVRLSNAVKGRKMGQKRSSKNSICIGIFPFELPHSFLDAESMLTENKMDFFLLFGKNEVDLH